MVFHEQTIPILIILPILQHLRNFWNFKQGDVIKDALLIILHVLFFLYERWYYQIPYPPCSVALWTRYQRPIFLAWRCVAGKLGGVWKVQSYLDIMHQVVGMIISTFSCLALQVLLGKSILVS